MQLVWSSQAPWNNDIVILFIRASNKHTWLHDVLHLCRVDLVKKLNCNSTSQIHFPIFDTQRSIKILPTWYSTLEYHFLDLNVEIVLHDRVYQSRASVTANINNKKHDLDWAPIGLRRSQSWGNWSSFSLLFWFYWLLNFPWPGLSKSFY